MHCVNGICVAAYAASDTIPTGWLDSAEEQVKAVSLYYCKSVRTNTKCCAMQRMLRLTPSQQAGMIALRNKYTFGMADIASKRQQLTQQLIAAAADTSDSSADTEARHAREVDCWQQLQDCAIQENRCLVELYAYAGHEVGIAAGPCI